MSLRLAAFFISENMSSVEDVHASCLAANTFCLLGGLAHQITLSLQLLSDVVSRFTAVCLSLWGEETGQCHLQDRRATEAAWFKEPPGGGYILRSLFQWQCQNKQLWLAACRSHSSHRLLSCARCTYLCGHRMKWIQERIQAQLFPKVRVVFSLDWFLSAVYYIATQSSWQS